MAKSLQKEWVFRVQWTDCPIEVEDEVRKLWQNCGMSNGAYYSWDSNDEHSGYGLPDDYDPDEHSQGTEYPIIDEYLKSKSITKCLINWWW